MPPFKDAAELVARLRDLGDHHGKVVSHSRPQSATVSRWMEMARDASKPYITEGAEFDALLQEYRNPLAAKLKKAAEKAKEKERFA